MQKERMEVSKWTFETMDVRVVTDEKGEAWWVAKDVCEILGIIDYKQASERLKDDERGGYYIPTPGGKQEMTCISEPGLYRLIFTSTKPDAEKFKDWVFKIVLPEIRRTGKFYIHKEKLYTEFEVIRQIEKQSFKSMAQSLKDTGENDRMHGHAYSTYNNLIYKLILGRTAKQLKEEMDLKKCNSVKDYIGEDKLKTIENSEKLVDAMLREGMEYKEIEQKLNYILTPLIGVA
jgi:prophage antirepressor-like protein